MNEVGRMLVVMGVILVGLGMLLWFGPRIPGLGRLPGDLVLERPNFKFYFPLATCILVSALLTFLFWLLRRH